MILRAKYFAVAALIGFWGTQAIAQQVSSISQRAELQAAMQQHIERNLVDGSYLHLDLETGEVSALAPVKAHPVILKFGAYYVLCSDFRDETGKSVNIDYYMAKTDSSYVVFHSEVDKREQLMALMRKGKVKRLE